MRKIEESGKIADTIAVTTVLAFIAGVTSPRWEVGFITGFVQFMFGMFVFSLFEAGK